MFAPCRITEGVVVGSIYTGQLNEKLDFSQDGQEQRYCMLWQQSLVNTTAISYRSDIVANSLKKIRQYNQLKDLEPTSRTAAESGFMIEMTENQTQYDDAPGFEYHSIRVNGAVDTIQGREIELEGSNALLNIHDTDIGVDWKEAFKDTDTRGFGTYLSDLMADSTTFVGPMVTLYVSILDFSNLHTTAIGGGEAESGMAFFFEFFLKSIVGLMLIVPLIILAVVLIMRIGILWIVIAFSPLLALLRGFGKDWASKVSSKITVPNIIGLIFAPVMPVFVLSISILFLQTLSQKFYDPANV